MTEAAAPAERSLGSLVGAIAGLIEHGGGALSTADIAGLKRMDPRRIDAPGFYKLSALVLRDDLPGSGPMREDAEERWAAIMVGLAHLGPLHQPGANLGAALVQAGFSDLRFTRLLRADRERLLDEIPALARFLSAKNVPADFAVAARLLLSWGRADEEKWRRVLARDYYAALARSNAKNA